VPLGDGPDRTANLVEVAAPTFAAVRGHKEQAASSKVGLVKAAPVQHRRVRPHRAGEARRPRYSR
jgi:hypothetical protein